MCKEGIDYIQGFYYSKPLPMWEYLDFIEKNNVNYIAKKRDTEEE